MAPSIKCLPHKRKGLSLDPQHPCSKLGVMALCNPSAGDRKAPGVHSSTVSLAKSVSSRVHERSCLRK